MSTALGAYLERDGILLDKIEHILRGIYNQLDIWPWLASRVAPAQEVDHRLAFWVARFKLHPFCLFVLRGSILIGDRQRYAL